MDARTDAPTTAAVRPLTIGDLDRAKTMILAEIKSLSKMVADRLVTHLSRSEELHWTAAAAENLQGPHLVQTSSFSDAETVRAGLSMDRPHTSYAQLEATHKKRAAVPIHVPTQSRAPLMTCDDLEELLAQRLAHDPLLALRWEQELQERFLAQTPTPGSTPLHSNGASPSITPISSCPPSPLLGLRRSVSIHTCLSNADADTVSPSAVSDRSLPSRSTSRGVTVWNATSDYSALNIPQPTVAATAEVAEGVAPTALHSAGSGPRPLRTGAAVAPSSSSGVSISDMTPKNVSAPELSTAAPAGLEPGYSCVQRSLPSDWILSRSGHQRASEAAVPQEAAFLVDGNMDRFGGGRQETYEDEFSRFNGPSSSCWSLSDSSVGLAERDGVYTHTAGLRPHSALSNSSAATAGEAAAADNEAIGHRQELRQGLVQEILRQLAMAQSRGGARDGYGGRAPATARVMAGAGGHAIELGVGGQSHSRSHGAAPAASGPWMDRSAPATEDLSQRVPLSTLSATSRRSASATPVYHPGFLPDRQPRQRQQPSPQQQQQQYQSVPPPPPSPPRQQQQQQQQQRLGRCVGNSGLLASSNSSGRISIVVQRNADAPTSVAGAHHGRPAVVCSSSASSSSSIASLPGSSAGIPSFTDSPRDSNTDAIASGLMSSSSQHLIVSPTSHSACRESYFYLSSGQPDL